MHLSSEVQPSLGCEVEDAFERDDGENRAAAVETRDVGVGARVGHRMLRESPVEMETVALRHARSATARRLHGHDDDAFIPPTTSIPGRATVRDRIDRARSMTVRQAIRLKIYTTRSLKRDCRVFVWCALRTGEGDPDTVMRDAEGDGLESDRSPVDSDTFVGNRGRRTFQTATGSLARQTAGSYPKAGSALRV
jgi:hypothetical protein